MMLVHGNGAHRNLALRVVALQGLLALCMAASAYLLSGLPAALSALAGGVIAVLPNAVFALLAFRHRGARAAQRMLADLYRAEAWKFVLTALGFALAFTLLQPLAPGWLFATYIVALSAYWFSPVLGNRAVAAG